MKRITIVAFALVALFASQPAAAQTPAAKAQDGIKYTAADVDFMQGMIHHHSQAVVMAGMAVSHGASTKVALFCKKVDISQRDEIELMQTWLKDRGLAVPDPNAKHDEMPGMDMSDPHAMMPGMLSPAQMKQLDESRGAQFDSLFLTFMIQHHKGALTMVATLFDSPGAGQTPEIFGYATGIDNDQRAEIERMEGMLSQEKQSQGRSPK